VYDSRIRLVLYSEPDNPSDPYGGIFFHPRNATGGLDYIRPSQSAYGAKVLNVTFRDKNGVVNIENPNVVFLSGQTGSSDNSRWVRLDNFYWFHSRGMEATWSHARNLNHEIGHIYNLPHSFSCHNTCDDLDTTLECGGPSCTQYVNSAGTVIQCNTLPPSSCNESWGGTINCCHCTYGNGNNFMGYNGDARAMTVCQWEIMMGRMMLQHWDFASFCRKGEPVLYLPQGQDISWGNIKILNRDVVVTSGTTLTVSCEVWMGEGKRIVVHRGGKLIIDGGKITSLCKGARWAGIAVHGNAARPQPDPFGPQGADDAGIVIVKNNSVIEHARTAVSTSAPGWPWPALEERFGGVVYAENSQFIENGKAAEFMKYGFGNKSRFIGCTIDGGTEGYAGASIWATDGVAFNRCLFTNMSQYGILAYDAGVIVKEANGFTGNRVGISTQATMPLSGFAEIGEDGVEPNYFSGNREHIVSNAAAFGPGLSIANNEMFNAQAAAVRIVGPSRYDIMSNSIAGALLGIHVLQSGSLGLQPRNRVIGNTFSGTADINAVGENREMEFLCNSFSYSLFDFRVAGNAAYGPGAIRENQGNSQDAAGNCFTAPWQRIDIMTAGPTLSFDYYVGSPLACKTPLNPGNYDVEQAVRDDCENQPPKETPTLADLQGIKAEIQAILDGGGTMEDVPYRLLEAQRYALGYLANEAMQQGDAAGALLLLDGEPMPFAQLMKYGIAARAGDFALAQAALDALPSGDAEMGAFKQVQAINLARLQQGLAYELSQGDSLFLEGIAQSELGVNAYARSILGLLAGRMFEDEDDITGQPQMQAGAGSAVLSPPQAAERIRFFPNPAQAQFTASLPDHIEEAMLELHSPLGQLLHRQAVAAGENIIGLEGRAAAGGLVLVRVLGNQGEALHTQLLVVR
jgi:hypothetical protein